MPLPLRRLGLGVLAGAWLLSLGIAFFAHRGDDVGRLPGILQRFLLSLLREPVATAAGLAPTVTGLAMAALVVLAWFGLGDLLARLAPDATELLPLALATRCLSGAALWALVWFALGALHLYRGWIAVVALSVVVVAFAPVLVLVGYGWARERGVDPTWASLAALMVAAIPTVYEIAGSGYVDLALAAYAGLAVRALGRWWATLDRAWIAPLAVAVGAALSIKLTAALLLLALAGLAIIRVVTAGGGDRPPACASRGAAGRAPLGRSA